LRQQRALRTSIPVNCPWGSARTCRVAPIHFRPPIAGPVLSPHIRAPLQSHVDPQQQDQSACSQESCHPGGPPWGQHIPRREAPIHFRPHSAARFEFLYARTGPEAAVVDDEGVSLPGKLIRPSRCHPRHAAHGHYFSVHAQFNVPGPPHVVILRTQVVGMKSLQAAERPADLAPVRFNC
jgi:hypothetical protein